MNLIFDNNVAARLDDIIARHAPSKIFLLTDADVANAVLPVLSGSSEAVGSACLITVNPGDSNKNLSSLSHIWTRLTEEGATRSSLLINLGGGVITDMGAFAAATFKRGIPFVNIPTTLLATVDASVGGKTGINFLDLKNQIGVFRDADAVIISSIFFATLPAAELRSGYAEMIKHAMLKSPKAFADIIHRPDIAAISPDRMLDLIRESVMVKKQIVTDDPEERGIRRALNLGHTAGHAFESLALRHGAPIPHGYAVAYGLVTELVLSHLILNFPSAHLHSYASFCREVYGAPAFSCKDYPELLSLMRHDKKNLSSSRINFTLLKEFGSSVIDNIVDPAQISTALDITADLLGI